jgi:hypothetical protein
VVTGDRGRWRGKSGGDESGGTGAGAQAGFEVVAGTPDRLPPVLLRRFRREELVAVGIKPMNPGSHSWRRTAVRSAPRLNMNPANGGQNDEALHWRARTFCSAVLSRATAAGADVSQQPIRIILPVPGGIPPPQSALRLRRAWTAGRPRTVRRRYGRRRCRCARDA